MEGSRLQFSQRSYQMLTPASSKLLQRKWDDQKYTQHRQRVLSARPTIDTKPPIKYQHIQLKTKKLQIEEERTAEIMRDNLTLLRRMSDVIHKQRRLPTNERIQSDYKSFHVEKRRKELTELMKRNETLLERLILGNSNYSIHKWKTEHETTSRLLKNSSDFYQEEKDNKSKRRSSSCPIKKRTENK